VFFSDTNVRELTPPCTPGGADGWKHPSRQIGAGAYGTVYKAMWRQKDVAVKLLKLPEEPRSATEETKASLKEKLAEIVADYTKEVEICCDLAHPNLVTLLGYATKPDLLFMQELMQGSSIDTQLYIEKWKPTNAQILKVALDVAQGMKYLHTAFQETRIDTKRLTRSGRSNVVDKPIVHRDLKSPNLLLQYPPPKRGSEGNAEDLVCKISDFGLSRDKNIEDGSQAGTALMTGCGSILWMAPEILLGELYNEKVDVFSYAMCLLEIVSRSLPWHGSGVGQQVIPVRLTQGKRPEAQLRTSKAPRQLKELIEDCWKHDRYMRPEFPVIVTKVEKLYLEECAKLERDKEVQRSRGSAASSLGQSRSTSPDIDPNAIAEGDESGDESDDAEFGASQRVRHS
jgi:serine/threonine protein kinase